MSVLTDLFVALPGCALGPVTDVPCDGQEPACRPAAWVVSVRSPPGK